jgi:hypothetical protein
MTNHHQISDQRISGIELAEIEVLMLIKDVPPDQLQRILDAKKVETLEQLDCLTVRNFLHYLRSL